MSTRQVFRLAEDTDRQIVRFVSEVVDPTEDPIPPDSPLPAALARLAAGNPAGRLRLRMTVGPSEVEVEIEDEDEGTAHPPERFAQWLRRLLRERGLSQEHAARAVGVSVKTISRWARGHTEPRLRELRKIQAAFQDLPPVGSSQFPEAE